MTAKGLSCHSSLSFPFAVPLLQILIFFLLSLSLPLPLSGPKEGSLYNDYLFHWHYFFDCLDTLINTNKVAGVVALHQFCK
jgi:hypothetical protein